MIHLASRPIKRAVDGLQASDEIAANSTVCLIVGDPVYVTQGGVDVAMAELALQLIDTHAGVAVDRHACRLRVDGWHRHDEDCGCRRVW